MKRFILTIVALLSGLSFAQVTTLQFKASYDEFTDVKQCVHESVDFTEGFVITTAAYIQDAGYGLIVDRYDLDITNTVFNITGHVGSDTMYLKKGDEVKTYNGNDSLTVVEMQDDGTFKERFLVMADDFITSHVYGSLEDIRVRFDGDNGTYDFTIPASALTPFASFIASCENAS